MVGLCTGAEVKISLNVPCHKTKEDVFSTVKHELFHSVLWKCGISALLEEAGDGVEEAVVVALENHLAGILKLDPKQWLESKYVELEEIQNG